MRRFAGMLVGGLIAVTSTGCALMHEVQPHRLWRFNRGPAPSSNPYFSVSDPIPQTALHRAGGAPRKTEPTDLACQSPVADRD